MAGNARPRRPYRPRYSPGHMLLAQQRDEIAMPVHTALAAIEMGGGCRAHRDDIASFLNITNALASRMHTAAETPGLIAAGMYALAAADRRQRTLGRWGFSGPEMQAVRAAVTVGDELIRRANSAVLWAVVDHVTREVERMDAEAIDPQETRA